MTLLYYLVLCQMFAVLLAATAALWDIETIVGTGPAVSLLGLIIAVLSCRRNHAGGFLFGLSAPSVSMLCFSIIFGAQWSPRQAAGPIGAILLIYAVLVALGGFYAARPVKDGSTSWQPWRAQFHISTLLVLTAVVAVGFSARQTLGTPGTAAGLMLVYCTVIGYWIRGFFRRKKRALRNGS